MPALDSIMVAASPSQSDDVSVIACMSPHDVPEDIPVEKPKKRSRTYPFSERHILRYQLAKKENKLRFPDLFMYHIKRPTEDVQREARIRKQITCQDPDTQYDIDEDHFQTKDRVTRQFMSTLQKESQHPRPFSSKFRSTPALISMGILLGFVFFIVLMQATGSIGIAAAVALPLAICLVVLLLHFFPTDDATKENGPMSPTPTC